MQTWLALEAIRDPGNLGTILRTADAVGVTGVILAGNCCDPYSREAVRASMGSIFARADRQSDGGGVARAHVDAGPATPSARTCRAAKTSARVAYRHPALLVMGSEGPGLIEATTAACSRLVKIPMAGRLDSLNLAVATALTLYQIRGARLVM